MSIARNEDGNQYSKVHSSSSNRQGLMSCFMTGCRSHIYQWQALWGVQGGGGHKESEHQSHCYHHCLPACSRCHSRKGKQCWACLSSSVLGALQNDARHGRVCGGGTASGATNVDPAVVEPCLGPTLISIPF